MVDRKCCADGCEEDPKGQTCVVCNRPVCCEHVHLLDDFAICAECESLDYIPPRPKKGEETVVVDLSL